MFVRSCSQNAKPLFGNPRPNEENDFDFTVSTARGDAYLELMEVAPLAAFGGSYEDAAAIHKAGELASSISKEIFRKSKRYRSKRELFLLLYITHWSFALGQATIQLLRYKLKKQRHVFSAVFYLAPLDGEVGVIEWLYPVPPSFLFNFKPEEHENAFTLNLDYQKWQITRGDGSSAQSPPSDQKS